MADNSLRINVEVNAEQLSKLAAASEQVATNVTSLTEQFLKGNVSAEEFATGIKDLSVATVASNPALIAQANALSEIQALQAKAGAAVKKGAEVIGEAGGPSGATPGLQKAQTEDLQLATNLKTAERQAQALLTESLLAGAGASTANAAGSKEVAAASLQAAEATTVQAGEAKALAGSLSQTGQAIASMGTAMVEQSEAVQIASARYGALSRDLAVFREQLELAKAAQAEAGLTTEQQAAADQNYAAALTRVQIATQETAAAERNLKNALADSFEIQQKKIAQASEVAAAQAQEAARLNQIVIANRAAAAAVKELTDAEQAQKGAAARQGAAVAAGPEDRRPAVLGGVAEGAAAANVEEIASTDELAAANARLATAQEAVKNLSPGEIAAAQSIIAADRAAVVAAQELTTAEEAQARAVDRLAQVQRGRGSVDTGNQAAVVAQEEQEIVASQELEAADEKVAQAKAAVASASANQLTASQAVVGSSAEQAAASETVATANTQVAESSGAVASTAAASQGALAGATAATEQNTTAKQSALAATVQFIREEMVLGQTAEQASASLLKSGISQTQVSAALAEVTNKTQASTTATAQNTAAHTTAISSSAKLAQSLMAAGTSAKDAEAALVGEGLTAKQAAAAMAELGIATEVTGNQTAGATTKVDQMTRALAYSSTRLASTELGVGQMGFAVARLTAVLPGLATVMSAIFPVFAAVAFVQILESVNKAMQELADEAQKTADAEAKFERDMLKSAEAVDKAREKVAGMISPLAQLAEEMANAGHKSVDLTSDVTALNTRITDLPSGWSFIGKAWRAITDPIISETAKSSREVELFTRQIADETHTISDLPKEIVKVTAEMERLRAEEEKIRAVGDVIGEKTQIDNINAMVEALGRLKTSMQEQVQASALDTQAQKLSEQEKMFSARTRAAQAQIGVEEATDKALVKLHISTVEEGMEQEEALERRKSANLIAEVSNREANLRAIESQEHKEGKTVDHSAAFRAMAAEKFAIDEDEKRKEIELETSANLQIIANDRTLADAQIEATSKVQQAQLALVETRDKLAFSHADTVADVEKAALPIVSDINKLYEFRSITIAEQTRALEAQLQAQAAVAGKTVALPTAKPGTDEFGAQLKNLEKTAPEVVAQLTKLNADILALEQERQSRQVQQENETQTKIREIRKEQLNNTVAGLQDQLVDERTKYQDAAIALKAQLHTKEESWSAYYGNVEKLADKNYSEEMAVLAREKDAVNTAMTERMVVNGQMTDQTVLTQEEGSRKLIAIKKREEEAFKESEKRKYEAAKEAVDKEVEEEKKVADQIGSEFAKMANTILTSHESIGRAAMKLGQQLELYIIEQGIKKVVSHYAESLLQMLAADNSWLAKDLGIHTAGSAAHELIDNKDTATHALAVGQRQVIDTAANAKTMTSEFAMATQQQTIETAETAHHAAGETAKVAATATGQAAQTAAATTGAASRTNVGIIEDIKSIGRAAATAAAHVYKWIMEEVPFPANIALAPAAAAATFAGVLAFKALAGAREGTVSEGHQPVLVHAGEVITHSNTLNALSNSSSSISSDSHAMHVENDQISMLQPGSVVVPKALAGGLSSVIASKGGTIGVAEGITPPSGLQEIPQHLPSNVSSTISSIVDQHNESTTNQAVQGGAVMEMPTATGGLVVTSHDLVSAKEGLVFSAKEGMTSTSREAVSSVGHYTSARDGFVSAKEGFVVFSAKEGFVSTFASARDGFVSASEGFVSSSRDVTSAREGFIVSAKEGLVVSARDGFASSSSVSSAKDGLIVSAKEGYVFSARDGSVLSSKESISSAKEGFIVSAKDGFVSSSQRIVSAKDGFVSSSRDVVSAKEGFVSSSIHSAKDGYIFSAKEGFVSSSAIRSAAGGYAMPSIRIASAAQGVDLHAGIAGTTTGLVVPRQSPSFSHAVGDGLPGGAGGPGGPGGQGGPGGSSVGPTINHHHYNVRIDGAMSHGDIGQMVEAKILPALRKAQRAAHGGIPT